jgi:KaiC/GvpD/RAD55 family RecA-like ATPase
VTNYEALAARYRQLDQPSGDGGRPGGRQETGHGILIPVSTKDLAYRNRILTVDEFLAEPDEPTPWVWQGYAAQGEVTILSGPPKVGKTTLLVQAAGAVSFGTSFLDRKVQHTPVLWLNLEQHRRRMRLLLRSLGVEGCRFYVTHRTPDDLTTEMLEREIRLVIVDSLSKFWSVTDENDAVQVTEAAEQLRQIAVITDAAVVLVHHDRKSGGEDGMNIRGSGALLAAVDHAVSMKRVSGHERRRVLEVVSREMEGVPRHLVIELADGFYRAVGTECEVTERENEQVVLDAVTDEPQTYEELAETAGLRLPTVKKTAKRLADAGAIKRTGQGKKGDPLRFSRNDSGQPDSVSDTPNPSTGTVSGAGTAPGVTS